MIFDKSVYLLLFLLSSEKAYKNQQDFFALFKLSKSEKIS